MGHIIDYSTGNGVSCFSIGDTRGIVKVILTTMEFIMFSTILIHCDVIILIDLEI